MIRLKKRKQKLRPVEVGWYDTVARTSHDDSQLPLMKSVGYLYKKSKKQVILLSMITPDADVEHSPSINIPRGCVRSIKQLR